jgi:meso-butanediol dehydrogenase / (S,S)-butanediol dehydrogenase / diacetyl reductase
MNRYQDRVAVITGAATGIGRATALRLLNEGAAVSLLDIDGAGVRAVVAGLSDDRRDRARAITCDVTDSGSVERAVAEADGAFGPSDVLVSNAGILLSDTVLDTSYSDWRRTFEVNVDGAFRMVRAVLPGMVRRGRGAISITASTSGMVGEGGTAAYGPSKAALLNFVKQIAIESAADGVRCNAVCPGWIDTPFNDPAFADDDERAETIARQVPMRREGRPEEIASAIAFLCSDDASYLTGHALVVDGGVTLPSGMR